MTAKAERAASQPVPDHDFEPANWMRRCGHIPYPQADRCGRPRRRHRGVSRLKGYAVKLMLGLERTRAAEDIAAAIERAGFVGQPPRLVATERQAVIDQARREQAAADARIAREVGQS